jgi:hypothetical protein
VRLIRLAALAALVAGPLANPVVLPAQSSMFGVRGLGLPGRPLTPRARATGGSFGLFDGESDLNPAAMGNLKTVAAGFVLTPTWRHWEGPEGDASLRDTRFPLVFVGGPVPGTRLALGVALGSYADRDFRLAAVDTVMLRDQLVEVHDTLSSLGGLNQMSFGAGYRLSSKTTLGAAIYWITGSSRLAAHRTFADTSFLPVLQSSELSYQGVGVALGITHQLTPGIMLGALLRSDGKASIDRDSTHVYNIDLPYTLSAGARIAASRRLTLAAAGSFRTWSGANSDLVAQGGPGSRNTVELSLGGELIRNLRRPMVLPVRLGIRYADLPFPVATDQRPKEFGLSAGTGLRFAQDRAGFDVSLEQAWRSEGSAYKERALSIVFGLSIRPYGLAR